MINYDETLVRQYETFIRDVINDAKNTESFKKGAKLSFRDKAKKRFKFSEEKNWEFLTTSLDTIGDSQFAIVDFLNFGLVNGKSFNTGERYLRLYGVLSANYIQQQSIKELANIFKIDKYQEMDIYFRNSRATRLRHYLSAHPVNYSDNKTKYSFKVDRGSLEEQGLIVIRNTELGTEEFNLFEIIRAEQLIAENYIKLIGMKIVKTLFKTSETVESKLLKQLNSLHN
ncbi:hypothetical protein [Salinimicrobium xinjiangense]|uniref:hypothetical protein n=1 Tax=Salinimicrobium xinjiangense TaxID=438596 RepID=UPI0004046646|nr:hypothetical protein [Salinimicrobium xinjiangense]